MWFSWTELFFPRSYTRLGPSSTTIFCVLQGALDRKSSSVLDVVLTVRSVVLPDFSSLLQSLLIAFSEGSRAAERRVDMLFPLLFLELDFLAFPVGSHSKSSRCVSFSSS